MLVAPGVSVPRLLVRVKLPERLMLAAPVAAITARTALVATFIVRLPLMSSVPVVRLILAMRLLLALPC